MLQRVYRTRGYVHVQRVIIRPRGTSGQLVLVITHRFYLRAQLASSISQCSATHASEFLPHFSFSFSLFTPKFGQRQPVHLSDLCQFLFFQPFFPFASLFVSLLVQLHSLAPLKLSGLLLAGDKDSGSKFRSHREEDVCRGRVEENKRVRSECR